MNQAIQDFVETKRIAIVGASRSGKKFGNSVYTELKQRGYDVYIVHPQAQEIGGVPCYPNLAALRDKVDGVVVCVPPKQSAQVLRDAAAAGLKKVWLQQGAQSTETTQVADELGLDPITGKCILMYAQPVGSVHGFHRAVVKIFGKL
jgi:predicted CoA-binding protein